MGWQALRRMFTSRYPQRHHVRRLIHPRAPVTSVLFPLSLAGRIKKSIELRLCKNRIDPSASQVSSNHLAPPHYPEFCTAPYRLSSISDSNLSSASPGIPPRLPPLLWHTLTGPFLLTQQGLPVAPVHADCHRPFPFFSITKLDPLPTHPPFHSNQCPTSCWALSAPQATAKRPADYASARRRCPDR